MSDAMEEIETQQTASAIKQESNGENPLKAYPYIQSTTFLERKWGWKFCVYRHTAIRMGAGT